MKRFQRSAAIILGIFLFSCGGEESSTTSTSEFDYLYNNLFNRCGDCHGQGYPSTENGPDFSSIADVKINLFKNSAAFPDWLGPQERDSCLDISYIKASNSKESLLVAMLDSSKINSNDPCQFISHLNPPQSLKVGDQLLERLKNWIDSGAPLN